MTWELKVAYLQLYLHRNCSDSARKMSFIGRGGQYQTRYVFKKGIYIGGRKTLTVVFVVNLFCRELKHGGVFFESRIVTGG